LSFAAPPGKGKHGTSSDPEACPSRAFGNVLPTARHRTKEGQIFDTRMGKKVRIFVITT